MIDAGFAAQFAGEWIAAWNARDLGRILSHYAEEIEFHSPGVARVTGRPDAFVRGKANLSDYWAKAIAAQPSLHFELERVLVGSDALTILYRNHRAQAVAETCAFNDAGEVVYSLACYGPAE
ncbi:MAG: nuclear transport factor 2 family protein [Parvularculaceae bacterium]